MTSPERQVKLYRTLIGGGIAFTITSFLVAFLIGAPVVMAIWVPVSYAILAWTVYRIVLQLWERGRGSSER